MEFRLGEFAGPLDLLLHLIRLNEMEIEEISVLEIIKQYLEMTSNIADLDLASDFLVMASTLLAIKARSLNGGLLELEGEEEHQDPLKDLVDRLRVYKDFKEFAENLGKSFEPEHSYFRPRTDYKIDKELSLSVDLIKEALSRIIIRLERFDDQRQDFFKIDHRQNHTVEGKMKYILKLLDTTNKIDFYSTCSYWDEIVVTFLAVLELIKSRRIIVRQDELFGEIFLMRVDS